MTEVRARVRDRPVSNTLCQQGRVDTGAEVEVENLQQQQNTEMHFITSGCDFCQQKAHPTPPPTDSHSFLLSQTQMSGKKGEKDLPLPFVRLSITAGG